MMPRGNRKVLLIGAIVIAGWVTLRCVPFLFHRWRELRWELEDRAHLLTRSRRAIVNEEVLADSAARVKEGIIALGPLLVGGGTTAQASDALIRLVGVLAARSNTRLAETRAVEDSATAGTLRRVAIHAVLDGDIRGVTGLLRSLAEDNTVVTADELRIVSAEPGLAQNAPEVLRVEVTVRGWYSTHSSSSGHTD